MAGFTWVPEKRKPQPYVFDDEMQKAWNREITETAGFVPLEVRFKQMEQAGYRARFFESEFTSKDVTDMYLNHPEFDLTSEDDFEDMVEKMELRNAYIQSIKDEVRKRKESDLKAATDLKESESKAKANEKESAAKKEDEKS